MKAIVAVVLVSAAALVAAQTPTPPVIPWQWQASHVSVYWNRNQTAPVEFAGYQYWDYGLNCIRNDFSMSGASFVTFDQFNTGTQYQIAIGTWNGNVPGCTKTTTTGSMANPNLFANATYAGRSMNGNTVVDVWWVLQWQPHGAPMANVTLYWDVQHNIPNAWSTVAVDGSSISEVSLFNFQPNVNVPGTGLFNIPPLCTSGADADADDDIDAPVLPRTSW